MKKVIKLDDDVKGVLRASRIECSRVFLPAALERKLYEKVDKVLRALDGKWNRGMGCHVFPDEDVIDGILDALKEGEVLDRKGTFQQFDTPRDLAWRMARMADIKPGHHVLEPSAGEGALISAIHQAQPEATVYWCEVDPKRQRIIHSRFPAAHRTEGDFLHLAGVKVYDRIVANPPFTANQDIKHVTKMVEHLVPGGKLVTVMSPHFTFAEDRASREFREKVLDNRPNLIETLPENTFKASGTTVRAVLVTLTKED